MVAKTGPAFSQISLADQLMMSVNLERGLNSRGEVLPNSAELELIHEDLAVLMGVTRWRVTDGK